MGRDFFMKSDLTGVKLTLWQNPNTSKKANVL